MNHREALTHLREKCCDTVEAYEAVQLLDAVIRNLCTLWIEHESNYNDRVSARNALNWNASEVLGPYAVESLRREIRKRCELEWAERQRRNEALQKAYNEKVAADLAEDKP